MLRPMSVRPGARSLCLALVALVGAGLLADASERVLAADHPGRDAQRRFMWAMAGQESGWDYYARNVTSGAFGKYQIMPANWPGWASLYLGDSHADQTPWNQEKVAFGKIRDLYRWLGSWKRVAYWWLTGSSERRERRWSSYARGYVRNIMRLRARAPRGGGRLPAWTSSSPERGDWRRSATRQRLRLEPAGRAWSRGGVVADGSVLKVRSVRSVGRGRRWVRVVTADGRAGWLPQARTVPAHRPALARRWRDIDDRGRTRAPDRHQVRPRPR
jgi:hypothetical protein